MRTRKAQSQLEEILEYRRRTAVPSPKKTIGDYAPLLTWLLLLFFFGFIIYDRMTEKPPAYPYEIINFHHMLAYPEYYFRESNGAYNLDSLIDLDTSKPLRTFQ